MKKSLAQMIKNKRLEKNLSMVKAAELIGINYVTLWRIETRKITDITYNTIEKLAAFLEISEKEVRDLC